MLLFAAVTLLFLFWIFVLLIDFYFRHSNFEIYTKFLDYYGVTVTPFQFRLYFTNFDRRNTSHLSHSIQKFIDRSTLGPKKSRILVLWFTVGALVSLISFIIMPIYLFRLLLSELSSVFSLQQSNSPSPTIYQQTLPSSSPIFDINQNQHSILYIPLHEHINAGITPVFPGINLPFSHMPIFIAVLIVASIVHEAGHAIAAANANVRVTGLGVFLFAIYPGAFTEVEPDELDRCSYAQKLRIFGAGIWHNIVLAIIGVLILISIPILSSPLYSSNAGVIITDVDPKSGLFGPNGLQPGYQISYVNQCEVRNSNDWANCFMRINRNHSSGFLAKQLAVSQMTATSGYILEQTGGEVQCCDEFNVTSSTHICFRYFSHIKANKKTTQIPPPTTPKPIFPNFPDFEAEFGIHPRRKRANLKMRFFHITTRDISQDKDKSIFTEIPIANQIHSSNELSYACLPAMQITEHAHCVADINSLHSKATLPPGYVCVVPALFNGTVLLRFRVMNHEKPVLYIGYLNEPFNAVDITELTPRFGYIFPWWIPRIVELFARYLITLSLAMGILNAVPCYGLDGQFISSTLVDYFCQNYPMSLRKRIDKLLMVCGTFIFCSNIVFGFIKSFFT